jgi:DNA polymerase-4
LIEVPLGGDAAFLAPLPVRDLPLVGPKLAASLQAVGIKTIGQAAKADPEWLRQRFGRAGAMLTQRARGIDPSPVRASPRVSVSVSREVTFGQDVADPAELRRVLARHADRVGADLRQAGRRARTITLKVRWPDFSVVTRSRTLDRAAQSTAELAGIGASLLDEVFAAEGRRPVRLIGLGATNLVDDAVQLGFDDAPTLRDERLDHTVDAIRERFGDAALSRGRPRRSAITNDRDGERI